MQNKLIKKRTLPFFLCIFLAFSGTSFAQISLSFRLGVEKDKTRFVLESNEIINHRVSVEKQKVILDIASQNLPNYINNTRTDSTKILVDSIRYYKNSSAAKIVMHLKKNAVVQSNFTVAPKGSKGYRIVIDVVSRSQSKATASNTVKSKASLKAKVKPTTSDSASNIKIPDWSDEEILGEWVKADLAPPKSPLNELQSKDTDEARGGKASLKDTQTTIQQLSQPKQTKAKPSPKAKPVIVIDAGHGGVDSGAEGYSGSKEKDITLSYALELYKMLSSTKKFTVYLTRQDDVFIKLQGRAKKASDYKADLFLSIHADASESSSAKGLSVYTLSDKASDKEAEKMMSRENDISINGINFEYVDGDVADFIIHLTSNDTKNRSNKFARHMLKFLQDDNILLKDAPLKSAGFVVLKGLSVPSSLIELGYITNKQNEKQLLSNSYRKRIAKSITKCILKFFSY